MERFFITIRNCPIPVRLVMSDKSVFVNKQWIIITSRRFFQSFIQFILSSQNWFIVSLEEVNPKILQEERRMKTCCTKMKTEQKVSTKTKTGKKVSAFLPMILTFLATQHWLHGLLFMMLGGSMMSMSMDDMIEFQRIMIVLTFVTVLWSMYKLFKDGFKNKGMMVMTSISSLVGIGYIIVTLAKTGW
jgi:cation transport ATPase